MNLVSWPDRLLTLDDWIALPEDNSHRYELAEGVLVVSPRQVSKHQRAVLRLGAQLEPQLPATLGVLPEVELVIEPGTPSTVRVPDLLVGADTGIEANLARWMPADVTLVVEILSNGTKRTDRVTKFAEYSEVGIEYYWMIDLEDPVSPTAFHLIGEHYENVGEQTGLAALELKGVKITIDLPALTSGRRPTTPTE
ncbi:Uma2 family endonuclease [Nocardia seriolae]|uniref:Putative restriction endonuclease domain-containing protein n=1 Tax=Nocardia seriolae TaxID=37332 RepID=A0A0B8NS24_9NOCA|nr:Uma2 family endonuclease [Nocardia seriolae]MTJ61163.1 Uma2 family endonuclease [Nocardia seriolae]MTJ76609.1 Uma2 family endonuclease [Nocardia seriolae]MTJ90711.1 Uma2 family endonuclease [Nocardia seriolae]MTK34670.1 Uma2 family endonuclease [Nocardia seriolae]MTK39142.1 Uma2 family endonuclease [Nocardia seriolae]